MKTITEERREIPVSREIDVVVASGGTARIGAEIAEMTEKKIEFISPAFLSLCYSVFSVPLR